MPHDIWKGFLCNWGAGGGGDAVVIWGCITIVCFRKKTKCHNLKQTPLKTFLNYITTKSTGTMQALYSAGISTCNLPALWGQKNNFCGMFNMLINCSGCAKKDNITKTNDTQQYFSHIIYMSAFLSESLGGERGKGASRSPTKEWGGRRVPGNCVGRHKKGDRSSKLLFFRGKAQTSLGGGDM